MTHVATANSVDPLPAALRDRYCIISVPAPRLADLPSLAANVLRERAVEAPEEGFVQALANDELDVIAAAWKQTGFSLRKLQKIVVAVIETRDAMTTRH